MNRKLASLLIPLLILTVFLVGSNTTIPKAHAPVIGLVCLADPTFFPPGSSSTANACPTPPVIFTASNSPNNQLKIAVNINASDIYLGFDITLRADHTILKPADADLTGSVLSSSSATVKCIGGLVKVGTCSPTDTADTIHFSASQPTLITTNGVLFTATFNVTTGLTSGITVGFQRGCSQTSVLPDVCLTMINGGLTPTPETAQQASFSNQAGFAISAAPTNLSLKRGASVRSTITVTSVLNFKGIVALSTIVSPAGLGATLTLQGLNVSSTNPTNSTTLTISAASSATLRLYSINVTGTASSTVLFTVISVNVVYFTMSASPTSLTISVGKNDSSTVTLTGQNGYAGTIPLTTATNATTGLTIICNPTSIILNPDKPGLPNTSKCTFIPSSAGGYNATITASDGTISHSAFVIIKALPSGAADFAINILPSTVNLPVGGSTQTVLVVTSISGLSGAANLTATTTAQGLTVSPSSLSLQLSPAGANLTILTVNAATSTATSAFLAPYKISITGTAQGITHTTQLSVIVFADFSISTSPAALAMSVGGSAKSNITLTNLGNLVGDVTLTARSSPTGLTASFNTTALTITAATQKHATLTINAPNGTSPGVYTITVIAKLFGSNLTHNATLTVNLVLHDVRIVYVTVNTSTATEGARVTYNIVVQNRGTVSENVTVDALVGDLTVNATSLILQPGEAKAVALTWNTSSFTAGTYALGAKVLKVRGQYNTANNIDMAATTFNLTAPLTSPLSQSIILILAIAAAAVVAVIIGFALLRRRTSAKTAL